MLARTIVFVFVLALAVSVSQIFASREKHRHQLISDKATLENVQKQNALADASFPEPTNSPANGNPRAILRTQFGNIIFELFPQAAPKTVANFINLAKTGFYDHTYFYRYVANFVVQGGGYYANQTSNVTVPLEYKIPNDKWTVGLARDNDPNSGSSEYFINLVNNSANLAPGGVTPNGYAVFAKVVEPESFRVVASILQQPTYYNQNDGTDEFTNFVVVDKITIVN
jgi:peptidyl-prolyl cis-trans isomerase A (cyclophilin A)